MFRKGSKADLFLELAKPDEKGFSRKVYASEFNGDYSSLVMGNGGDWCRDDGRLAQRYNVYRHKVKNKIVYVKLNGFNKKAPINRTIPQKIRKALSSKKSLKKCAVLYKGSGIEIDHKIGRRDDPKFSNISQLTTSDFQHLSKAANDAKRQHCKNCGSTGMRFDARKLGYHVSQIEGGEVYQDTCVGCYWYDPYAFNQAVSKDFQKKV